MRVIVTAGPTREYIDAVRFISNASSGQMGYAVAAAALGAGHQVTLLSGPVSLAPPAGVRMLRFVCVDELQAALREEFPACDALVMTAAVGDFRIARPFAGKLSRKAGPITIELTPTDDVLAGVAAGKRPGQIVVAFAVEDGPPPAAQAKAAGERVAKHADYVVVNTPAAMGASQSQAAILGQAGTVLPWAVRSKEILARKIVSLLSGGA